jgi:hypothetical protein
LLALFLRLKGEAPESMKDISLPSTIILTSINHFEVALHSLVVVPYSLEYFSILLIVAPTHLAVAISFVPSE